MIYVTGDTHGDFRRFTGRLLFQQNDSIIICGDFGLLWEKNRIFYNTLKWLSGLPFKILWVAGNHENYSMIAEYPLEEWNGGKVRHIARDKVILLERGQVFQLEGNTFFTFGGASSHDIQGGILDRNSPSFPDDLRKAYVNDLSCRILNESWWPAELPTEEELQEGRDNLERVKYKVDYVISHCASDRTQRRMEQYIIDLYYPDETSVETPLYSSDILTNYFDELEDKLLYKRWYFGHYHEDFAVDDSHSVLYDSIIPLGYSDILE